LKSPQTQSHTETASIYDKWANSIIHSVKLNVCYVSYSKYFHSTSQ